MKTKQLIVISALTLVGLTSCEKNLYDPNQNQEEKKVTDLVIPANFDWEMTKATTCNVTSTHSAQLSIYLDEACSEGNLLANVSVKAGSDIHLPLSILKNTQKVYVQYESAAGKKVVAAPVDANGNISFAVPAEAVSTKAMTRAGEEGVKNILFYPENNDGTIMFEDNYPELGDYDFNDFVARYRIQVELSDDAKFIAKIILNMNVVAIGGVKPYIPCLRLPYNHNIIADAKVEGIKGSVDPEVELEILPDNDAKSNAVFIFHGAEQNANKDGKFLNTEKDTRHVGTKAFTVTITFNEGWAFVENLNNSFDLFLISPEKDKEIHLLGYNMAFGEKNDNQSVFYDTEKNTIYKGEKGLVWAINIPDAKVKHAYEKENFLHGYPDFANWASSGGVNAAEWYTNAKSDYLFPIFDK